jgi:hypothetical protein
VTEVAPVIRETTGSEEERTSDAIVTLGIVILVLLLSVAVETARLHEFRAALRSQ